MRQQLDEFNESFMVGKHGSVKAEINSSGLLTSIGRQYPYKDNLDIRYRYKVNIVKRRLK